MKKRLLAFVPVSLTVLIAATEAAALAGTVQDPTEGSETSESRGEQGEQEEREEPETERSYFASITVTATGSEVEAFDVSTPVTVVPGDEIERRMPENAVDVLRDQPGVDVNGVGPNQARPVIRGLRGLRILFLENGLRLNNARRQTDFGEISGLVDMGSVEQVEVVRGPASVLYGTDAVGGVLNLITKTPEYGDGSWLRGSVELRYTTASEQERGQGFVAGRRDRAAFNLGLATRSSADYEAPAGRFGDIELSDDTRVVDTSVDDDSLFGYFGYDLSDRHRVTLRLNRYRAENAGFGFVEPALLDQEEDFRIRITYPFQDFDRYTLGYFGSALESSLADSVDLQVYWQENERELRNDIDIDIGPIFPGALDSSVEADTSNFTDLETFGLRAEIIRLAGENHLLTYGAELFSDDSFNTDSSVTTTTIRFPFPPFEMVDASTDDVPNSPNATNTSWGVFLQDELLVGSRLKLTLGGRYQTVSTEAEPTPGWDIGGLDFDDETFVGTLGAIYSLTDSLKVTGSVGTAFRAPNIIERLFNGPTPEGAGYQILNADLRSEESENAELGLKYLRRNAIFELTYFRNDIDDGIIQDFLGPQEIDALPQDLQDDIERSQASFVVQQRNIERLRYEGVEAVAGYRFSNGISLGANYTHLDTDRRDSAAAPTNDAVSDKVNGFVRYQAASDRYWLEYRIRHVGSEPAILDPNEPIPPIGPFLPSFTVHQIGAGLTLFDGERQRHLLTLLVDNLTDELYAEFSNATFFRPQPKRSLVASYRLEL